MNKLLQGTSKKPYFIFGLNFFLAATLSKCSRSPATLRFCRLASRKNLIRCVPQGVARGTHRHCAKFQKQFLRGCLHCFIICITVLLIGCVSNIPQDTALSNEKTYIGGYFQAFNHRIRFVNLDTRKKTERIFRMMEIPSIVELPPGRWATVYIDGTKNANEKHIVPIPVELLTIIELNPGDIVFLGEFDYSTPKGYIFERSGVQYSYPFEKFMRDLSENYMMDAGVKPVPLLYMPRLY